MTDRNGNILLIALVLAGIVAIVTATAAGYFYFQNQQLQKASSGRNQESTAPIPSITPTPAQDETANWKTYTSGDTLKKINISFSLKYPTNWFTSEENPNHTSGVPWVIFSEQPAKDVMSRSSSCFSVRGGIWSNTTSIDDLIKQDDSLEILLPSGTKISTAPKVLSIDNVTINSMIGVKRNIIKYNESEASWQVFLKDGANFTYGKDGMNFFILESCPGTDETTFNQILSTFKFINQNANLSSSDTTNWKTYTNTSFGFLIKYPGNYFKYQDTSLPTEDGIFLATSAPQGGNSPKFLGQNDVWLDISRMPANQVTSVDDYLQLEGVKDRYADITTKEPVLLGGVKGYKILYSTQTAAAGSYSLTVYIYEGIIIKNDKIYIIDLSSWNQTLLTNDSIMFDQILSTFKFL